jgi:spermidine/putrescine transport system substrate-binding protein
MRDDAARATADTTPTDACTRRGFVGRGAGAALAAVAAPLLASCGSSGSTSSGAASTTATTGKVGGTVRFFGWEGNDVQKPMADWNHAHGIKVQSQYSASHEDVAAKFTTGAAKGTDILNWDYQTQEMYAVTDKIFDKMDAKRLPNLKHLNPSFPVARLNGQLIGVPGDFGTIGITYDSAKIAEPQAWADLLDPKLKGHISMVNDPASAVNLTANILKFDTQRLTKDQLNQIGEYLKRIREQCRTVAGSWGDMTTLLVQGEIVACYDGWVSMNGFAAASGKKTIKTNFLPKEGSWSYIDMYTVPQGASNAASAYAWINELLSPKGNAEAQNANLQGSPVAGVEKYLSKEARDLYPYHDLKSLLKSAPVTAAPPTKNSKGYATYADAVKVFNAAVNGT